MFVAALFTIIKTWKQTKVDKWIKMWGVCVCVCVCAYTHPYIYSGILLNHKKECKNVICNNMDRPRDFQTK